MAGNGGDQGEGDGKGNKRMENFRPASGYTDLEPHEHVPVPVEGHFQDVE